MRAAFGLVSILVTIGIIAYLMAMPGGELDGIAEAKKAQDKTRAMVYDVSGKESTGDRKKSDPLTFADPEMPFRTLTITAIAPGSELAAEYGLRVGDKLKQIGAFEVGSAIVPTEDDARLQLDVLRDVETIVVVRNGQTVTLDPNHPAPAASPAVSPVPGLVGPDDLAGGPAAPAGVTVPAAPTAAPTASPAAGEAAVEEQRGYHGLGGQLDAIMKSGGGSTK